MNLVVDELAHAVLVHVDPARLSVMDFTAHYCGVGVGLDFETRDSVVVDVVRVKETQSPIEAENAHILPVVDMVPPHDRVGAIFHPNPSQSVAADLVVFVETLGSLSDNETDIFAVGDFTLANDGLRASARNTDSGPVVGEAVYDALLDGRTAVLPHLKHLLPFSEYKIHSFDEIETILPENGLK